MGTHPLDDDTPEMQDFDFDIEEAVEEGVRAEIALCNLLNELIGENALLAALDGTLASKLTTEMLTDDVLDLIRMKIFVCEDTCESGNKQQIIGELSEALYGVAQFFHFLGQVIDPDWVAVLPTLAIPEEIEMFSEPEFSACIARQARLQGMNDREVFALLEFLCAGESGTMQ